MNTLARLFAKSVKTAGRLLRRLDMWQLGVKAPGPFDGAYIRERTERFEAVDRAEGHYLAERYGLDEKPEGWNDAVLGWFFRGPDRRTPLPPITSPDVEARQRAYDQQARLRSRQQAGMQEDERAALVRESIRRPYLDHPLVVGKGGKIIAEAEQLEAELAALAYPTDRE